MKCRIIRFFYKIILFNFKRSFFIKHFYRGCLGSFDLNENEEDRLRTFFKELGKTDDSEIWENIRSRIMSETLKKKKKNRKKIILGFAMAFSIVFVVSFLLLKHSDILPKKKETDKKIDKVDERVLITSIEIDGRKARRIYFSSKEKNRTIIWVQKN